LNRICYEAPKVYRSDNLTVYLDTTSMEKYSHNVGRLFELVYPDLETDSALALGKAIVDFEVDFAKTYKQYDDMIKGLTEIQTYVSVPF
jgi:hypothetical protein